MLNLFQVIQLHVSLGHGIGHHLGFLGRLFLGGLIVRGFGRWWRQPSSSGKLEAFSWVLFGLHSSQSHSMMTSRGQFLTPERKHQLLSCRYRILLPNEQVHPLPKWKRNTYCIGGNWLCCCSAALEFKSTRKASLIWQKDRQTDSNNVAIFVW